MWAHSHGIRLNPDVGFSFPTCRFSYELEKSHSGSHSEDGWTEISWRGKGCQEAILAPLAKGISFSMKNDQEAVAKVPQWAKFNCKTSSICFQVLLVPSTAISVQQSHLCAFYLKSNRFPDTAIFSDRGSASISLEFQEFVNTNPIWTIIITTHPTQADGRTKSSKAYCCKVLVTRQSFNKCLLSIAYVQETIAMADFLLLSVLLHIMRRLVLLNSKREMPQILPQPLPTA